MLDAMAEQAEPIFTRRCGPNDCAQFMVYRPVKDGEVYRTEFEIRVQGNRLERSAGIGHDELASLLDALRWLWAGVSGRPLFSNLVGDDSYADLARLFVHE